MKQFSEKSLRKRVQGILGVEIRKIETEIIQIRDQIAATSSADGAPVQQKPTPNQTKRYEVELTNYGWDQSDKFIKLFITLEGVHSASEDDVSAIFNPSSIVVQIRGVNNKDYKLNINNLLESIDVEKSYRKIKTNMVTVYAKKVKEGRCCAECGFILFIYVHILMVNISLKVRNGLISHSPNSD